LLLLIDNYDSFSYNLVQYLGELGAQVQVYRNDRITVAGAEELDPQGIVISPGPGRPEDAGVSMELIRHFAGMKPILGVCLGHQCIGAAFGSHICSTKTLMHGKTSRILHDGKSIYAGLRKPFTATRYHSLVIDRSRVPDCLEIAAVSDDGEIMGIRHNRYLIEGVQFHPESILTPAGKRILKNFIMGVKEVYQ